MKKLLKRLLPRYLINFINTLRLKLQRFINRQKTIERVFTDIYANNAWGGAGEYCSGSGSVDSMVVDSYILMLNNLADKEGFRGACFVDLGCGDFRVGRQLLPLCSKYIGVDIVRPLIDSLAKEIKDMKVRFMHLNIVEDDLPKGDICLIRQVLQHLSNNQIKTVLDKLSQYELVFITEHYPTNPENIRKNIDKPHGGDIRLYDNSGVYLSDPPFLLNQNSLRLVLEVPVIGGKGDHSVDTGVIRTFLYKPNVS